MTSSNDRQSSLPNVKAESNQAEKIQWKIPVFPKPIRIILSILANFLTTLNFTCGVIAIVLTCIQPRNPLYSLWAAKLILLSIILDFSDGIPARLANKEPGFFGTVVDSFADAFSFGFACGVIIAFNLPIITPENQAFFALAICSIIIGIYFTFCAIFRLTRFAITPSKKWYNGLPASGAACAAALYIILKLYLEQILHLNSIATPIIGLIFILFVATMMITSFRYPATKLRKNFLEIFLLVLAAIVLITLVAFPVLDFIIYPTVIMIVLTCLYVFYGPFYFLKHMLQRVKEN